MNQFKELIKQESSKEYFRRLIEYVENQYNTKTIFPKYNDVFKALELCDYNNVKVVILGQDPYHEKNQANGLAFSVNREEKIPPSLRNIYKELNSDLGIDIPTHGDLTSWASQGVLLLNTVLTVEEGKANSHKDIGWQRFSDEVIMLLNKRDKPMVFILWGNNAKSKMNLIDSKHYIISSAHPSPLSANRGFFNSKPFSKANAFLKENGLKEVDWRIGDV